MWVVVDFSFQNLHKLSFSYFDTSRLKASVSIVSQIFLAQKHRENLKVRRFLHRRNSAFCRRNNRFSILFLLQSGDHVCTSAIFSGAFDASRSDYSCQKITRGLNPRSSRRSRSRCLQIRNPSRCRDRLPFRRFQSLFSCRPNSPCNCRGEHARNWRVLNALSKLEGRRFRKILTYFGS